MGWSTKTQNNRPWGWEQGRCPGACVPRSVVSPRSCPHSTKSWQPLGTAQLLVQVSGHPARPGVSESVLCVLTVIFHEPYYPGVWQAGGAALPWSLTEAEGTQEDSHSVILAGGRGSLLRLTAQDSDVLCGHSGRARASHM